MIHRHHALHCAPSIKTIIQDCFSPIFQPEKAVYSHVFFCKNTCPAMPFCVTMGMKLASQEVDFILTMHGLFWRCEYVETS